MAQIVATVPGDQRLRLGGFEEFARTMSIGTNWYYLRLAIRAGLTAGGVTNQMMQLTMGFSQGSTNPVGDSLCTDFIGVQIGNLAVGGWTYAPATWTSPNPYGFALSNIGGVKTRTVLSANTLVIPSQLVTLAACIIFVDVWKLSPTLIRVGCSRNASATVQSGSNNWGATSQQGTDLGYWQFISQIESELPDATYFTAQDFVNVAYAGSGLWDTINIHWAPVSDPSLEISDVAVVRFM